MGPFRIPQQINPVAYRLALPPEYRIHNVLHVSVLEPVHTSDLRAGMRPASPGDDSDDGLATPLNTDPNTGTADFSADRKGVPFKSERNYPVHAKELLAIADAFKI
ncbi:hypothetical protein RI367_000011 [Sorochytrium milnesiophthora]